MGRWEIAIGVPSCCLSTLYAPAVDIPLTDTAAVAAAPALLPCTSTGCRVRYTLLLCYAVLLRPSYSSSSLPLDPPPHPPSLSLYYWFSDTSSLFCQTPDSSDILRCWSPLHENMRVHPYHGVLRGGGGRKLVALPCSVSPPPSTSPVPSRGYYTWQTCPLLRQIASTTRSPFRSRVLCLRPPLFYPSPPHLVPCPGCLLGAPVLPTRTLGTQMGSSILDLTYPINACDAHLPSL